MEKIKVVWICSFSSKEIRDMLPCRPSFIERIGYKLINKEMDDIDYAKWNVNAISEFEKYTEVELHVICPTRRIKERIKELDIRGIHYHFFRDQYTSPTRRALHGLFTRFSSSYKNNRRLVRTLIKKINPSIVHLFGAENPIYSTSFLDLPDNVVKIVQLQTLLSDPRINEMYPQFKKQNAYKSKIERDIINRADYIGIQSEYFRRVIRESINSKAVFCNTSLAIGENINETEEKKEYDYVYFAADVQKAIDLAINAFILASKKHPGITLNVIGFCSNNLRESIEKQLKQNAVVDKVAFEGKLPTHEDVIKQIRRSKIALLPLKTDLVSGTVREAMCNGIPVVTTITKGTPDLNKEDTCVMLSEIGDVDAMANNMIAVLTNPLLYKELRRNSLSYASHNYANESITSKWLSLYKQIIHSV